MSFQRPLNVLSSFQVFQDTHKNAYMVGYVLLATGCAVTVFAANLRSESTFHQLKGQWKSALTCALQRFKNNISQYSNSVSDRGRATIMTSKEHYASFVKGEGWWTEIRVF